MRFLFCARPAFGHVYPLLPLALAARTAGHDVAFATTDPFLDPVRRLGLATHDVGVAIEDARAELLAALGLTAMPRPTVGQPDVWLGGRMFIEVLAPRTAADLAPVLETARPDLLVYESYDVGAAVAAAKVEIATACVGVSPRLPDEVRAQLAGFVDRLWHDHGLDAPFDLFTGELYVDQFPAALRRPGGLTGPDRLELRPVPYREPNVTGCAPPAGRGRPLVYLTLGTVVASDAVLRPVIEGLAALDVDVLVALGSAAGVELSPLPDHVQVRPFVDQVAALCAADLAVHHGGSGSLLAALTTGTPQLLLPTGADQFWNAALVTDAGLAAVVEPDDVDPATIAHVAAAELGWLRPAAAAARAELAAMPHPDEVIAELVARVERPTVAA